MHARQQIRDRVAAILAADAGVRCPVHASRVHTFEQDALPVLLVYTTEEGSEQLSMGGALHRELTLLVIAAQAVAEGLDAGLDTLAAQVETALAADVTFGIGVKHSVLERTAIEMTGEGDYRVGTVTLEFTVVYHTAANDPTTII
jgi:hypothetical protein